MTNIFNNTQSQSVNNTLTKNNVPKFTQTQKIISQVAHKNSEHSHSVEFNPEEEDINKKLKKLTKIVTLASITEVNYNNINNTTTKCLRYKYPNNNTKYE